MNVGLTLKEIIWTFTLTDLRSSNIFGFITFPFKHIINSKVSQLHKNMLGKIYSTWYSRKWKIC